MAYKPFDERHVQAAIQLRWTVLLLQSTLDAARHHTNIDNPDSDPFKALMQIRDRFLTAGRRLADFIDEHQPR